MPIIYKFCDGIKADHDIDAPKSSCCKHSAHLKLIKEISYKEKNYQYYDTHSLQKTQIW